MVLVFREFSLVVCLAMVLFAWNATRVNSQRTANSRQSRTSTNVSPVLRESQEPLVDTEQQVAWKPASGLVRPLILDPRRTWQTFLRHSERENKKRKKARNRVRSSILQNQLLKGPPGERGPPGARGPRGLPGANITKEELLQEFRGIVKVAAEERIQRILAETCFRNHSSVEPEKLYNESLSVNASAEKEDVKQPENSIIAPQLFEINQVALTPCIREGFLWLVSEPFLVEKKSFVEVGNFHAPFAEGGFQRSKNLDPSKQRFGVPQSGIYQIQATLLIERGSSSKAKNLGVRDLVSVFVCINSLCQNNIALQNRFSLESQSHHFSVLVSGALFLKEGQYLSVFLDNSSRLNLRVLQGSLFSVVLLGI